MKTGIFSQIHDTDIQELNTVHRNVDESMEVLTSDNLYHLIS